MVIRDERQLRKTIAEIDKRSTADGWNEAVTCLKRAHAHASHNSISGAVENYERAADLYTEAGFDLKVVDVLKQLLKLAPDHAVAQERLSRLLDPAAAQDAPLEPLPPVEAPPSDADAKPRRSKTNHPTLPPRSVSKGKMPAVSSSAEEDKPPPRSVSRGKMPAVASKAEHDTTPPRTSSRGKMPAVPPRSTPEQLFPPSDETTMPAQPAPPPAADPNPWEMATDKFHPRPARSSSRSSHSSDNATPSDVSSKLRPVASSTNRLLLLDGRDQRDHARRLESTGTWQVAMALEPASGDGAASAIVIIKGPRVFVGLADGTGKAPGAAAAAERACLEIHRLRSAVEPAVVLETVDLVLHDQPGLGEASGMAFSVTRDQVVGACVGNIILHVVDGIAASAVGVAAAADGPLLGSGKVAVSRFGTMWSGSLVAATETVVRHVSPTVMTQCLALQDVGEAAQALLAASRDSHGKQREDALVVVVRAGSA